MKRPLLTAFQVSVQDINQYGLVAEGAEKVASIVTQYRTVETLYIVDQFEATSPLKEHVTYLYARALKLLVKAKNFYMRNTANQYQDSIRD